MHNILLIVGLAVMAGSCSKSSDANEPDPSVSTASTMKDVSYGADSKQKLDLYLPANRTSNSTPLLVIIHGGGWSGGDKSLFDSYITQFQQRLPNFAFANLNYRLVSMNMNKFPTQENDIKSAMKFLMDNTEKYQFSRDVVILGISAGGHLGMLQGYKHHDVVKPKAIVSFFGPVDLIDLYKNPVDSIMPPILQTITGYSLAQNQTVYRDASPIFFVDENSPPTMLLHGGKDHLVPLRQAYMMRDKLAEKKVRNELVYQPNEGHDGWSPAAQTDAFNRIVTFVNSNL
jgi:acetyl esterase/lipase